MGIHPLKNRINQPADHASEADRFFKISLDMLCVAGFDGYFKRINSMWENTFSLSDEELFSKPLIEFVHPEDRESTLAAIQTLADNTDTLSFENRYRCADGSYKRLLWNAISIPQEQLIYAVAKDITNNETAAPSEPAIQTDESEAPNPKKPPKLTRTITLLRQEIRKSKRAQKHLRQREERLRSYLELSAIGIAITSPEKGWLEVNDSLCKIFGYSRSELMQKSWESLTHPEDLLANLTQFNRALAGDIDSYSIDQRFIRSNGQAIHANISVRCVRQSDGSIDYFVTLVQDTTERVQTLEAQRQSEARLNLALKAARMGVWDWDIASGQVTFSDSMEALFGLPPNSFAGTYYAFLNLIHPEDRSRMMLALACAVEAGHEYNIENRIIWPNGTVRWVAGSGKVLRDSAGNPVRMIGTVTDITARKQATESLTQANEELEMKVEARTAAFRHAIGQLHGEIAERKRVGEQLRKSQEMLQQVMDNIPQLIAWKDANSVYLGCNRSMARVVGLSSPEDIIGKTDSDLPWKLEEANFLREGELRVMHTDTPEYHIIESHLQADGNQVWLDKNRIPLHDGVGNVVGILVTSEDITERASAEDALRKSEAQLRQQATQLEATLRQLQKTQTQLIQTEKMSSLGQLVAGVAHEINNPINFIYGNIEYASQYIQQLLEVVHLYEECYPTPMPAIQAKAEDIDLDFVTEDLPKVLNSMRIGADRIRAIVLSLRNFSRLDEAEKKRVDIHAGIDSTLLILQHRLKAKTATEGIEIIKEYGNLPLVDCYAGQLNQVFMNLLSNAIDAIESQPAPRIITIRTSINSEPFRLNSDIEQSTQDITSAIIRICDNGPGMTQEVQARLFDPFFTTKPVGKGTGLGLTIAYQIIVEKHGGRLICNSAPAQGTEFIIEIPLQQTLEHE
ncbi:MAG: PAS domain S-box protein [Microcoleus vaginatus WJT46-NPBG5]|jgi:PAS domain S-box-containing protein|nr:PAS domain S-box protein [Microcoleus vaginatus WJT46-NPBG5]